MGKSSLATQPVQDRDRPSPAQYFWIRIWNILAYTMLALSSAIALTRPEVTWEAKGLALVLAALWGAWYWFFVVKISRWNQRPLIVIVSFYVAMAIAAGLSWIYPSYLMLVFSYYGLSFSLLPLRAAIAQVIVLSFILTARIISFSGRITLSIANLEILASFLVSAFFSSMLGFWITTIIHESRNRKKMIDELEATRSELAKAERQAGMLEERQRLAGEIHDTLAQGLTSIILHLETAEAALEYDSTLAQQNISAAREAARENLAEARRFVWALRPEVLEREPLDQALRRVATGWSATSGISSTVLLTGEAHPLPLPVEVTLLRTVQEALTNVKKHSGAHQVNLTLSFMNDEVILDIQDDGQGFDPQMVLSQIKAGSQDGQDNPINATGFGLPGMRRRVEQVGGTLEIETAAGEGTTLVIVLPLEDSTPNG
jgi:signal transduction histidine kinase